MAGRIWVVASVCVLSQVVWGASGVVVQSPNGGLSVTVGISDAGQLTYTLLRKGRAVIEPSPLGVTVDGAHLGRGVSVGSPDRWTVDESYRTRGGHSRARNHFCGARVPVTHAQSGTKYILDVRVFDDGIGFRYVVDGDGTRRVSGEDTANWPRQAASGSRRIRAVTKVSTRGFRSRRCRVIRTWARRWWLSCRVGGTPC